MAEMRVIGHREMLEAAIPDVAKEHFDLVVTGGDTKVMWNPRDRDEAEAAEATFDSLREQRFNAYRVNEDGDQGEIIEEFDPEAGKLILAPPMAGG